MNPSMSAVAATIRTSGTAGVPKLTVPVNTPPKKSDPSLAIAAAAEPYRCVTYPIDPRYAGRQFAPAVATASQSGELRSQFAKPTAQTAFVQPLALLQLNSVFAIAQERSPQPAQ